MYWLTALCVSDFGWAHPGRSVGLPWGHPCDYSHLVLDLVWVTYMALLAVGASCCLWCPGSPPHGLATSSWLDQASLYSGGRAAL